MAVAVGLLLAGCSSSSTSSPSPTPTDDVLVGRGAVAVPVPASWSRDATHCGDAVEDTVVYQPVAVPACLVERPPSVTSLTIDGLGGPGGLLPEGALAGPRIGGLPAYRTPVERSRRSWRQSVVVPRSDVVLTWQAPTRAELERRVASVRAAPQGRAFVPDVTDRPAKQGVRVLERLGFEVERVVRRVPPEEGNEGEVASTSPGRGRLVARGATVTMVVTTQR
ncbi:PASTA domain-containing protein [Solicola sp. PLA-1-18]